MITLSFRLSALSSSEQQKSGQLSAVLQEKAALQAQLDSFNSHESKKMGAQLQELQAVKERIQGVKAEKIILEEKVANLTKELKACKSELGTTKGVLYR